MVEMGQTQKSIEHNGEKICRPLQAKDGGEKTCPSRQPARIAESAQKFEQCFSSPGR